MPAFLTHRYFGLDLLSRREEPHKEAFLLGSQGPDPYFFHGQIPWRKRPGGKEVAAFGTKLHHIDPSAYFLALLRAGGSGGPFRSYVHGLLAHFALDSVAHPFVFSRTGFSANPEKARVYAFDHTSLETAIDLIYSRNRGLKARPWKEFSLDGGELGLISKGLAAVDKELEYAPALIGEATFLEAVKDYRDVLSLANWPLGLSLPLFDFFLGTGSQASALHYPKSTKDLDYLNLAHLEWPDPFDGHPRRESFPELYERAVAYALSLLGAADLQLREGGDGGMAALIDGRNHDGGVRGAEMRFFSSFLGH